MREIRFHGSGGHGIVVAAKLLADAAATAGFHAQSFASYGALRRGGMVESYVRIDKKPISPHCKIYDADLTVLMDDRFVQDQTIVSAIKSSSHVLINTQAHAEAFPLLGHARVTTVDAGAIARDNGLCLPSGLPIMNTVILGAVLALIGDISLEHLADAIREAAIPNADKNLLAARLAYENVLMRKSSTPPPSPDTLRAVDERHPVYFEKRSPCEVSCPAGEPVRTYISLIQLGQHKEALEAIQLENPFPGVCGRVCFHPCESQCNRMEFDGAVSINALERAAFDLGSQGPSKEPPRREKTGKTVAIIGAGPAGLSCAYFLTLVGHRAIVFEAMPVAGGLLRLGIPAYRLPRAIVDAEINRLIALGVTIKQNTTVGKEITFEQIVKEYDACFIATGAHASERLNIPGEETLGVLSGLDFLRDAAFDRAASLKGEHVVVIGGGNTAVDAARTARRLGAHDVTIVYRRSIEEMPAYAEERQAAEEEGVRILHFAAPIRIHSQGSKVRRIECQKTECSDLPREGRPRPRLVDGTNFSIDATVVITAAGETPVFPFLPASVEMDRQMDRPVIKTDYWGSTSMAGVFAGGDAAGLSRSVANAVGSGKRAAIGIDLFLKGNADRSFLPPIAGASMNLSMQRYLTHEQTDEAAPIALFDDLNPAYFLEAPRQQGAELKTSDRVRAFAEVRSGLRGDQAMQEASRCFQCGRCTLCENCYIFCSDVAITLTSALDAPVVTESLCGGCGLCIHECPRGALSWKRGEHG